MSCEFDYDFPLPTVPVNWQAGWIGALPPYGKELAQLRLACCTAIFDQQGEKTGSRLGFDAVQTMHQVDKMLAYADKLCQVCSDTATKSSNALANAHSQLHRRHAPLEFEWTFPAESDPKGRLKACCVRCTLPGFEYLCVLTVVCVVLFGAADTHRQNGQHLEAIDLYRECKKIIRGRVAQCIGKVISAAQWHKLHRDTLPIQLLPTWLALLGAKAEHCAQLSAIMTTNPSHTEQLLALTRMASRTVLFVARSARRLLVAEHYLRPNQQLMAQDLYTQSIAESHRLRIQFFLQEADQVIAMGQAVLVRPMLDKCTESADVVWPPNKPMDETNQCTARAVHEKIAELKNTASQSVTASMYGHEWNAVSQYLDRLEMLHWSQVV